MDMQMSVMNGYLATQKIRKIKKPDEWQKNDHSSGFS